MKREVRVVNIMLFIKIYLMTVKDFICIFGLIKHNLRKYMNLLKIIYKRKGQHFAKQSVQKKDLLYASGK